jgi:hypothetical protein
MKKLTSTLFIAVTLAVNSSAQPALTIYNQNFAVVRDTVPLDLQSGVNSVRYACATRRASTHCKSLNRITGTTPCRRNCCCRCSRARRLTLKICG